MGIFQSLRTVFLGKKARAPTFEDRRLESRGSAARIRSEISDFNIGEKAREFFALVHGSFASLMGMSRAATYSELKRGVKDFASFDTSKRRDLLAFLDEVAHLEYDFPEFVREKELELAREKDAALKYLKYLEKKSDVFTRPKLVELDRLILSDEPVTARQILEHYISCYEELLDKVKE